MKFLISTLDLKNNRIVVPLGDVSKISSLPLHSRSESEASLNPKPFPFAFVEISSLPSLFSICSGMPDPLSMISRIRFPSYI
jgi:hypothetical protein